MIILRDEFDLKGYQSLLSDNCVNKEIFTLEYLIGKSKPNELFDVYISKNADELYVVLKLNHDDDIVKTCEKWDDQISRFVFLGCENKDVIKRFKHNIVMIILSDQLCFDRSCELNLNVTRKIIVHCSFENNQVLVCEDEAVELPFYQITSDSFVRDEREMKELELLIPDDERLRFLLNETKRVRRSPASDKCVYSYSDDQIELIREWLNNEN
jgi:hypothetical protein